MRQIDPLRLHAAATAHTMPASSTKCSAIMKFCWAMCWLLMLPAADPAAAQAGPARPIRLIVPFPPGGGLDLTARLLAPGLSEALSRTIVVDNRGGAGGFIGLELAARASPDGNAYVMFSASHVIQALVNKASFDLFRDFAPVSEAIASPYALVVPNSLPVKSVSELVSHAKAHAATINYASAGNATLQHVATELFAQAAGFKAIHVPYKGVGPILPDLFTGRVHMLMSSLSALAPHIRAGSVRALAVTTPERSPMLPALPTMIESGVPGYAVVQWQAVLTPAGTPAAAIERFQQAMARALRQPEVARSIAADGSLVVGSEPGVFKARLENERVNWARVAERAGLRAQ